MKTIMIIGAGFGQVPAIKRAKELGLKVITIDKNPNALGMKLADFAYPVDIIDVPKALKIAEMHKIDGVMTMQTDLPVPTVGEIIDEMGLKGAGIKVAKRCSNKIFTRKLFEDAGVPQPNYQVVKNKKEAIVACKKIGYPCIFKSADSSGSRGVTKVDDEKDIEYAMKEAFKFTRLNEILVEEYISGEEIGSQGFSVNGECELALIHNDTLSEPPYMIPIGHSFPVDGFNDEELERIEKDIKTAVNTIGINDGPSNIDLIVDERDNSVKIIEIGARIGATCLPELVKYYTGIDWIEAAIRTCLGEIPDLKIKQQQPVAARILKAPKSGIFHSYKVDTETKKYQMVEIEVTAKPGEQVNELKKGTDRIGKVLCFGGNAQKAEQNALKITQSISFKIS